MSNAIMAKLPRFDQQEDLDAAHGAPSWLKDHSIALVAPDAEEQEPQENPVQTDEDDPQFKAKLTTLEAAQTVLNTKIASLDAVNAALSDAIEALGHTVRAQVSEQVQAIAKQLFPKLAENLLADELVLHIPKLVPSNTPNVIISVAPEFSAKLTDAMSRGGALPPNCQIVSEKNVAAASVEITWPSGGFDFDFNSLLEDCLSRLQVQYDPTEE